MRISMETVLASDRLCVEVSHISKHLAEDRMQVSFTYIIPVSFTVTAFPLFCLLPLPAISCFLADKKLHPHSDHLILPCFLGHGLSWKTY